MAYPALVARPSQARLNTLYGGGGLMSPPMNQDTIVPNATGLINNPNTPNENSDDSAGGGGVTGSAFSQYKEAKKTGEGSDRGGGEAAGLGSAGTTDAVGMATAVGNIVGMATDPFGAALGVMGALTGVTSEINSVLGVEDNPVALNSMGYAFGEAAKAMGLGDAPTGREMQSTSMDRVSATKEANPGIFGGGEMTGGGRDGGGFGGGGDRTDGGMQEGRDVSAGMGDGPDRGANSGTGGDRDGGGGGSGSGDAEGAGANDGPGGGSFHAGGLVKSPKHKGDVNVTLQEGEYVINREAVKKHGTGMMERLNKVSE